MTIKRLNLSRIKLLWNSKNLSNKKNQVFANWELDFNRKLIFSCNYFPISNCIYSWWKFERMSLRGCNKQPQQLLLGLIKIWPEMLMRAALENSRISPFPEGAQTQQPSQRASPLVSHARDKRCATAINQLCYCYTHAYSSILHRWLLARSRSDN
jgi:hypothetical protein